MGVCVWGGGGAGQILLLSKVGKGSGKGSKKVGAVEL